MVRAESRNPKTERRTAWFVFKPRLESSIASSHRVSVSRLRAANGMSSRNSLIRPGQRLTLPAGATSPSVSRRYVVSRGDTLTRIADSFGVRLRDLLSANTLRIDSVIHPGQTLRIP